MDAIQATARKGRCGVLETEASAELRGNIDSALCHIMADAGLRRSEAPSLVWDDVELWTNGSGRLTVRQSKTDTEPRAVYLTLAAESAGLSPGFSGHSGRVGMARRMAAAGVRIIEVHVTRVSESSGYRAMAGPYRFSTPSTQMNVDTSHRRK